MKKSNKSIIALLIVLTIGLVGLTVAYFANSTDIANEFTTKPYGDTFTEEFISPDNWLPGDTTNKSVVATNTGEVDEAVRISLREGWTPNKTGSTLNGWIHTDGTKSSHTTESELATDERVAVINFDNDSDWNYEDGYYYYKYKIAPGETTSSLIKSVTFNPNTKLDDTCTTTEGNGTKTITCNSSGEDYDNAKYTLTFTVETVQYDKYASAWQLPQNTTVAIGGSKPQGVNFAQHIMSKSNDVTITNYTDGVTTEAYTFEHDATEQTPALTDYRYIGASPNNYVEFNCDDNGENCEIWRAIGVFYVDDGNNNWEWRVKLVRGSALPDTMQWDDRDGEGAWSGSGKNEWNDSKINTFLNGSYLNRQGDTSNFGLKELSQLQIEDAIFYLGGRKWDNETAYGSTEEMYLWERGTEVYCEDGVQRSLSWNGKIGLMYLSDYGYTYSKSIDNGCFLNLNNCYYSDPNSPFSSGIYNHPEMGWLYNNNLTNENLLWFLSPSSGSSYGIFHLVESGAVHVHPAQNDYLIVRPTLYLSSSVKTTSGDGSIDSPYKLSL